MHIFMLVIMILGQPDRADSLCATRAECESIGANERAAYSDNPHDFSYRVDYVVILDASEEVQL